MLIILLFDLEAGFMLEFFSRSMISHFSNYTENFCFL